VIFEKRETETPPSGAGLGIVTVPVVACPPRIVADDSFIDVTGLCRTPSRGKYEEYEIRVPSGETEIPLTDPTPSSSRIIPLEVSNDSTPIFDPAWMTFPSLE